MITFLVGMVLTLANGWGVMLSRKRFIPLHVIGIITGVLLMVQEAIIQTQ